ncbi:hypothetical protein BQ8482_340167 [Mesorhizobium delmotii]|uniref:Uncharacterized protein n=1 Tax=Mesorhizobium delmotii TaxID=1631247 RepID=A0A2P9AQ30_9HYPH|nr:hypothetical protein BQ8482_340167 [Mesorhizobium delmotii]
MPNELACGKQVPSFGAKLAIAHQAGEPVDSLGIRTRRMGGRAAPPRSDFKGSWSGSIMKHYA